VLLPCYRWCRRLVVPKGHPLAAIAKPTIKQLAAYPIVTYVFSLSGPSSLKDTFARAGIEPEVALTARDADVIKTYVRLGLGVGIVAAMAIDPLEDSDLVSIDATHLFPAHTTWLGFRRGSFLRRYMFDFMREVAPHLERALVNKATQADDQEQIDAIFADVELPFFS
jgi:LysR family cys regulon transcriptional activator